MTRWPGHRGQWRCVVSEATGRMYMVTHLFITKQSFLSFPMFIAKKKCTLFLKNHYTITMTGWPRSLEIRENRENGQNYQGILQKVKKRNVSTGSLS